MEFDRVNLREVTIVQHIKALFVPLTHIANSQQHLVDHSYHSPQIFCCNHAPLAIHDPGSPSKPAMLSSTLLIALGAAQLTTALTIETRQGVCIPY